MSDERADPIPPGDYEVDITTGQYGVADAAKSQAFSDWVRTYGWNGAAVKVLNVTETRRFFRVLVPTPRWPVSAGLGLPRHTTAQQFQDAQSHPAPAEPWDFSFGKVGGVGLAIVLGLWFMSRSSKS